MPSELSSSTLSQPGRLDGEPPELPGVAGLFTPIESTVVVSGLGLLSESSPPVLFEHVLGTGDATDGFGDVPVTF